ncbi:unnamed protein product [Caenorhabditis angaria]|uniref:PAN-3 domain-containing protein n=1 Tax=Caenorhabditis angaria TaxID=860376 RepID=A0A9P1N9W3_9PELO|nr:unnamed protein product [Caenorhabditis angaria]
MFASLFIVLLLETISCSQIILIYGTLNVSDVLSTTSVSDKESCSELCLSEVNCVSLFFIPASGSCSIYSMYQVLSYQKNDVSENIVGIKTNSSSSTCPSTFSDVNLSGDVNGIAYQFSADSSFSYQTCPDGYKQFTRTRGIWCMKLYDFQTAPISMDISYCSQYSAYSSGFDNSDEVEYITSEIVSIPMLRLNIGTDGYRSPSCYNSTTIWCDDYEWSNNYTNYPTFINWGTYNPSRWEGSIQANQLSIWVGDDCYVDIFDDISNEDLIYGFICGVPLGNWDFN